MCEENCWELIYKDEDVNFTCITARMKVPGGFLYREEINRDNRFMYPLAAIALQFVPHAAKQVRKKKVKVKKKRR